MKNICYIIGAGEVNVGSYTARDGDFIICADGGYKYKDILGRECDLVVGDFDSLGSVPQTDKKIVAPCEKDETDMDLSLTEGIKRGYKTFVIFGALGGERFDHSIANVQLLHKAASSGLRAYIAQGDKVLTCIKNETIVLSEKCEGYISVFSLTDESRGVTLKNLKYELTDYTLTNRRALGASNEFIGKRAEITVKDGVLLICFTDRV